MTLGPTDAELSMLIREDIRAMPDTATVLRPSPGSTPGGWGQNFAPVSSRIVSTAVLAQFPSIAPGTTPCRLTASVLSGGSEQGGGSQLASTQGYTMVMPPDTDLKPSDRVEVQGKTLEVIAVKGAASWNLSDSATLMEITR